MLRKPRATLLSCPVNSWSSTRLHPDITHPLYIIYRLLYNSVTFCAVLSLDSTQDHLNYGSYPDSNGGCCKACP